MRQRTITVHILVALFVVAGVCAKPCAAEAQPAGWPQLLASYTGNKESFVHRSTPYAVGPGATLHGLNGVMVVVEDLSSDVEEHGLTRFHLKQQVEARLQTANIRLLTSKECFDSPGRPYLYLDVNTHNTGAGIYGYSIRLELNQETLLARNRAVTAAATTWTIGRVGVAGARHLPMLAEEATSLVNEFIRAYRDANPD